MIDKLHLCLKVLKQIDTDQLLRKPCVVTLIYGYWECHATIFVYKGYEYGFK